MRNNVCQVQATRTSRCTRTNTYCVMKDMFGFVSGGFASSERDSSGFFKDAPASQPYVMASGRKCDCHRIVNALMQRDSVVRSVVVIRSNKDSVVPADVADE